MYPSFFYLFCTATIATLVLAWRTKALEPRSALRRAAWRAFAKSYIDLPFPDATDYTEEGGGIFGNAGRDEDVRAGWIACGKPSVFKIRSFNIPFIVSVDKKDLALNNAPKPVWLQRVKNLLGPESLIFKHGEEVRRERQLLGKAFGVHNFERMQPTVNEAARRMLNRVDEGMKRSKDGGVGIYDYLPRATFEIIADSIGVDKETALNPKYVDAMLSIISTIESPLQFLPYGPDLIKWYYGRDFATVNELVTTSIRNRTRARLSLTQEQKNSTSDLMDVLLNTAEQLEDDFVSEEHRAEWLRSNTQLMFLGGTDTTSLVTDFCFTILATRPDVQAKIKEELTAVFPLDAGRDFDVTFDKLEKLKYTTAVIRETVRLFPVTSGILRQQEEFHGVKLPKNSVVYLNFYLMHRSEEYYSRPLEFIPERWLPDSNSGETVDMEAFASFSTGFRTCLGKFLAIQEMRTILSRFLRTRTVSFTALPKGANTKDLPKCHSFAVLHVQKGYRLKFAQDA